jgi:hypothetical protein
MNAKSVIFFILIVTGYRVAGQRSAAAPDFFVVQYAGSIGYFSAGAGYDIFQNRGRASLHFGTVPKGEGGPLNIFCAKVFIEPWTVGLSEHMTLNPLDVGLMVSYHMGDDFKLSVPDYFASRNYYWWHTAMRLHLATESSLTIKMDPHRFFKKFTAYAELNSNDLYLVSFVSNAETLKFEELIKLGIGVRLSF